MIVGGAEEPAMELDRMALALEAVIEHAVLWLDSQLAVLSGGRGCV
jgi:hypothetical protein